MVSDAYFFFPFAYYDVYLIWKNSKVILLKAPSPQPTEARAPEGGLGHAHKESSPRGGGPALGKAL